MESPIVLVTVQAGGHFNTGMLLAKKLASQGSSIIVILPWFDPSKMNTDMSSIELRTLQDNHSPYQLTRTFSGIRRSAPIAKASLNINLDQNAMKKSLGEHLDSLRPKAVILDRTMLLLASRLVDERGIPKYVLYTGATSHLAVTLFFHGPNRQNVENADDETIRENVDHAGDDTLVHIPGLPALRKAELPLDVIVKSHSMYVGKKGVQEYFVNSNGILLNTSSELEGPILEALCREYPEIRFIPIGPLYPSAYLEKDRLNLDAFRKTAVSNAADGEEDPAGLFSWLDNQPPASLVFICFGSFIRLSDEMIRVMASGLESSGFRFLWSLPEPKNGESDDFLERVLPSDFVERTSTRGKILTGWVPQQLILSHPCIGAFLTHCGWSSIIECILLAGVPILAWPFLGDQPPTCRHLVDEYRIAVDIGVDGMPSSADVERALHAVMEDKEIRKRASERRDLVRQGALSMESRNLTALFG